MTDFAFARPTLAMEGREMKKIVSGLIFPGVAAVSLFYNFVQFTTPYNVERLGFQNGNGEALALDKYLTYCDPKKQVFGVDQDTCNNWKDRFVNRMSGAEHVGRSEMVAEAKDKVGDALKLMLSPNAEAATRGK
jgi:hypothetical protein